MEKLNEELFEEKINELDYLKLLAKQYPSIGDAATEIINLEAILNLPKGTEHFLTDLHGEYEPFVHVLKNGSGVVKIKIEEIFGNSLSVKDKKSLATLVYYPEQKLEIIAKEEKDIEDWYKITLYRLMELCKYVSSKYTRSKVRKALPKEFAYIIEELLHEQQDREDKQEYYKRIITTIIDIGRADEFIIALSKLIQRLVIDRLHIVGDIFEEDKQEYYKRIITTIIDIGRADEFIIALSKLIQRLVIDRLHIVGDIFDRGPRPDIIMDTLIDYHSVDIQWGNHDMLWMAAAAGCKACIANVLRISRGPRPDIIMDTLIDYHSVDIQWGNHDMLWMAAAAGCKACIANVLRISLKYSNVDVIEDMYGINLLPLATFALRYYKEDPCINFIPNLKEEECYVNNEEDLIAKMHKAITIIQFKLEAEIIRRRKEFKMDKRMLLDKINYKEGTINIEGKVYELKDKNFPTVNKDDPFKITDEEYILIDKLVSSFINSEKLQKHVTFLFSKGSLYLKYNSNLLFHGCIPLNSDKTFKEMEIEGKLYKGRALLDFLFSKGSLYLKYNSNLLFHGCIPLNSDKTFKEMEIEGKLYKGRALLEKFEVLARKGYFNKVCLEEKLYGMDIMWYLWCGPVSSLFGKEDMTTFERYFIEDKSLHKEFKNPYFKLRDDEEVCDLIFEEFGLDKDESRIINGHVPVNRKSGESPIKANGKILVIDGGFSKAYRGKTGIAGYTLIYNSYGMVLASHQPFASIEKAILEETDILSTNMIVDRKVERRRVGDTDIGNVLKKQIRELKLLLIAYRKGFIKENN